MIIRPDSRVADIAAAMPSSIRVFQRFGIDFCCGGQKPLGVACDERGVAYAEVSRALVDSSAERAADDRDWAHEPLTALADHIVARYHEPLWAELPRLQGMAARVRQAHAARSPVLVEGLNTLLAELANDLGPHMLEEEEWLFPAIRRFESATRRHGHPSPQLDAPIHALEQEHARVGEVLAELRALTEDYIAPDWACRTFRGLYEGIEELERDLHVHVHLENNVLFPRVMQLAATG